MQPVPLRFVIANVLFALLLSLSSSNVIVSLPTFTFTEPDVNINEPLAMNPLDKAGSDALSFVSVTDKPSNIFTGVIFLIGCALSLAIYYMAKQGMLVDKKSKTEVQDLVATNLNDKGLKKLIDSFTEHNLKRQEIINSKTVFPDPSEKAVIKPAVQNPAR